MAVVNTLAIIGLGHTLAAIYDNSVLLWCAYALAALILVLLVWFAKRNS